MTSTTRTPKKDKEILQDHLNTINEQQDANYLTWKQKKIETALEQSKERSNLIPAEKVWERLGLEH